MRRFRLIPLLVALMTFLSACGPGALATDSGADGRLKVLASFYPLQFVAQQVGGDYVNVTNLTPPAAEPHDLELSLAQARKIGTADVVILLGGFQAAVDEAVEQQNPARVVDAANYVTLYTGDQTGVIEEDEEHDAGPQGMVEDEHDHDHGSLSGFDPHFWLDPTKLAQLAGPVAAALSEADPEHAAQFAENAAAFEQRLSDLDAEAAERLAPFRGAMLVTNHTAFGYLARRYGLNQVGIAGLDPESEPSPARMREIANLAREHNVKTLFYESLVNPRVVQTLANDMGIQVAELNPIEGLGGQTDPGADYFTLMQRNIDTLVDGLSTS